ncbi:MAG: hypothetical protein ABJD53_16115 [Gammaproteobacteria bacterium]
MIARSILLCASALMLGLTGCSENNDANRTLTTAAIDKQSAPVRRDFAQVDGVRIAYEVHGDLKSYSMGATTALVLAVRHPDVVDKQSRDVRSECMTKASC